MSRRLPAVKPRQVIRTLVRAGFFVHHVKGSHYALRHSGNPRVRVTVPYHNNDLKRSTLKSIIEQARLTVEAFLDLLWLGGPPALPARSLRRVQALE